MGACTPRKLPIVLTHRYFEHDKKLAKTNIFFPAISLYLPVLKALTLKFPNPSINFQTDTAFSWDKPSYSAIMLGASVAIEVGWKLDMIAEGPR